jgi:hypothetical protein
MSGIAQSELTRGEVTLEPLPALGIVAGLELVTDHWHLESAFN